MESICNTRYVLAAGKQGSVARKTSSLFRLGHPKVKQALDSSKSCINVCIEAF
jgi:hypothetical protein